MNKNSASSSAQPPRRERRRLVSGLKEQARRGIAVLLKLIKSGYQSLPLSYRTKARHRNLIAKVFPRVLLVSGSAASASPEPAASAPPFAVRPRKPVNDERVSKGRIDIPASPNPQVSVIIPVYGRPAYTLHCLASITANPPAAAFEVIVVDDGSKDETAAVLKNGKGIRIISQPDNLGFIKSCNRGAAEARGDYLYFLNNDTEVTPGWLDELLRTFSEFPGTGLAGSRLIYPDGRLQEAGGIIWRDGTAGNFGRMQDPLLPVFNYAREVDYCSGASIMVSKSLFVEAGGFDEYYLPAYAEDADLALKIRDKGYRVIYQPLSTIIHYEGGTSGTRKVSGVKAHQIDNLKKLREKWKSRLAAHQPAGENVDDAKDRRATRRALVIDLCTPTPDQDAASIIVYNMMLLLREMNFQVTFIPEDNFLNMPPYTQALQRAGIETLYAPYFTTVRQHLKESGNRYDLALLIRPAVVERYAADIRKFSPGVKILFHTIDLHFLRMEREAGLQSDSTKQKEALEMKARELAAMRAADSTIVVSHAEKDLLSREAPDVRVRVFPLILNAEGTIVPHGERKDIIFVGGYQHHPNIDAVRYYVSDIMPLLRKRLPGVRFHAVGSKPPADIQTLACEDVIVTGFVENLAPLLDRMRVSVAPIRFGAGIKGKVGTAMCAGLPVVATTLAAEGMSLSDGENILIADGAKQFTDAIVKLYEDESLWNRISQNSVAFADKAWGGRAAWKNLSQILGEAGFEIPEIPPRLKLYESRVSFQPDPGKTDSPPINTLSLSAMPYLGIRYQIAYHQCNLNCPYCIASWKKQKSRFDAINFDRIIRAIKKLPYRVSLRIGVGGEIFTSPELMAGVASICNAGSNIFNVSFSTNLVAGWDKTIKPFLASLDTGKLGIGCTLHDTVIPDVDAFFDKAEKIKQTGADIYIGLVAIPGRFQFIAEYKKRCEGLGIPLIMNGLVGNLQGVETGDASLVYPRDYTKEELARLKELWDTPHSYQLLLAACETKGMVCSSGRNYIYIDHQGNVFPCKQIRKTMGNILTDKIVFQREDTLCPESVCWCGNENQALRIVDEYYDRSKTLRMFTPKKDIPPHRLYEGYHPSVFNRSQ